MLQVEQLQILKNEMERIGLDICGLAKILCKGKDIFEQLTDIQWSTQGIKSKAQIGVCPSALMVALVVISSPSGFEAKPQTQKF